MNQLLEPLPPSNRGHIALRITNDMAFQLVTELIVTEYFAHHYSHCVQSVFLTFMFHTHSRT